MCRAGGVICIFFLFVGIGLQWSKQLERQQMWRENWYQQMIGIRGEIAHLCTPLYELFEQFGKVDGTPGEQFFYELTQCGSVLSLSECWHNAMPILKNCKLQQAYLLELGNHLGNCDYETQLRHMDRYIELLALEITQGNKQLKGQQQIVRAVFTSVGALAMVLLL